MEIAVILLFFGIIIGFGFLKTRLSNKWHLIVTSFAGVFLLTWFWFFETAERHWKVLITLVVVYSIYNAIRKFRRTKSNIGNVVPG